MDGKKKFREEFQRYIDDLYSKSELESILKRIKDHRSDEEIDQLTEQLWNNLEDETITGHIERSACEKEAWRLLAKSKRGNQYKIVRRIIYYSMTVAAIVLFVVKGFAFYETQLEKQIPMIAVTTKHGERKSIFLPDSTELAINSCTTVKYPKYFVGNSRYVELSGEGYFKVKHNPEKPFIVKMRNMSITVLGTIFNVKSHPLDQTDIVEVKEGKVQVDLPEAMMRITSGEHAIINKVSGSYSKEKDEKRIFAIWRNGGLRFDSTPIQDVAKELERVYSCKITFEGDKPFDNLITGIHEKTSLENILVSIEYVTGIHYRRTGNLIILYKN